VCVSIVAGCCSYCCCIRIPTYHTGWLC